MSSQSPTAGTVHPPNSVPEPLLDSPSGQDQSTKHGSQDLSGPGHPNNGRDTSTGGILTTSNTAVRNPSATGQEDSSLQAHPMDMLLARLSEQHAVLVQQNEALDIPDEDSIYSRTRDYCTASNSLPITPAGELYQPTLPTTRPSSATFNQAGHSADEVLRLKMELAEAQAKISRLEDQGQQRPPQLDQEMAPFNGPRIPSQPGRDSMWANEDARSDTSDAIMCPSRAPSRGMWGSNKSPFSNASVTCIQGESGPPPGWYGPRPVMNSYMGPNGPFPLVEGYRSDRLTPDPEMFPHPNRNRRNGRFDSRLGTQYPITNQYGSLNQGGGHFDSMAGQSGPGSIGLSSQGTAASVYPSYPSRPAASALSPHATEFTSAASWRSESGSAEGQTYLPPTEPLNYRRLLDRNVNCNWKYIVDKIVCNNDQQASIFLQQKLKVGTPEQKYDIVEAIVAQAYPLMVNRFGNFLVQRCFEHGTPEQVVKIAMAIRGNTLNLSMDPFGCHVVQKAFDSVPESYKAVMVHELLRRIPETVIHRYACHVWQKLFELRWTESPPQIMRFVNDALHGMWHEVALGETGSLVVQNIFENCLEEDKRPCIEEVLANIDIVAHGQFGNWCIQHICEHGAPSDRSRAIDHVIRYAAKYSTDQFASKVVEKCLKIGGTEFLGRYLDRVCERRVERPRIPLIDIASDQYGNYLIQYILTHASSQHRDVVAAHIRKHMVSLRGSKFGSRVGMLCTNPASATRPGPAMGPAMTGRMAPGPRFNASTYR